MLIQKGFQLNVELHLHNKNLQWQKEESYHPYFARKTYKREYFILKINHTKLYLYLTVQYSPVAGRDELCKP